MKFPGHYLGKEKMSIWYVGMKKYKLYVRCMQRKLSTYIIKEYI